MKNSENIHIRPATVNDVPLIFSLIKELAEYEHMSDEVVATKQLLEEWMFEKEKAEAVIGEIDGVPVGFALFFHNFSTFLGRAGLYLEDLYVQPQFRGKGLGKALLVHLGRIAVERGCGRMEWSCLDWNRPSIDFYRSMGAVPMSEWTVYRLTGDTLEDMYSQSATITKE